MSSGTWQIKVDLLLPCLHLQFLLIVREGTAGAVMQEQFDDFSVTFNVWTSDRWQLVDIRLHFHQFRTFQGHDILMQQQLIPAWLQIHYFLLLFLALSLYWDWSRKPDHPIWRAAFHICMCAHPAGRYVTVRFLSPQFNYRLFDGLIELMHF